MPATTICPTCSAVLAENARFCPKDGTTIRPDSVLVDVRQIAGAVVDRGRGATVPVKTRAKKQTATESPNEDPLDPLVGCVLDARYRIKARLGTGGVGAVYEGEHIEIKKTVAVKVLHAMFSSTEEFRKRFEREAQAASRLQHPGCVQVLDFGRVQKIDRPAGSGVDEGLGLGMPYLVMEFVRGHLLLDRLIEGPAIPPVEAVRITRDVLAALKHAHGLGIVHRDVKPANIMLLASDGATGTSAHVSTAKLLDFGLAKQMDAEGTRNEPLTQAGMVFGTPGYLSPEQAAGRSIDARADLYSLGVVLFEMCCDRRLFDREDPLDAVRDHMHTVPPSPRGLNPEISPALDAAILKALEKDPHKRHASAQAFAAALAACPEAGLPAVSERSEASRHKPPSPKLPSVSLPFSGMTALWRKRPRWALPAGAGALVVLLGIGLVALAGSRGAPPPPSPVPAPAAPIAGLSPAGQRRLDAAFGYQRKLWCSDALEELEKLVRDEPAARLAPLAAEVARPAIACLLPKTQTKALRFLTEQLGDNAVGPLEAAAAGDANPEIRKGAQRALEKLRP